MAHSICISGEILMLTRLIDGECEVSMSVGDGIDPKDVAEVIEFTTTDPDFIDKLTIGAKISATFALLKYQ